MWVFIIIAVVVVLAVAAVVVWMLMKKQKDTAKDQKSHVEQIDERREAVKRNYMRSKALLELYGNSLSEKNLAALKKIVGDLEYVSPSPKESIVCCDNAIASAIDELSECLSKRVFDAKVDQFVDQKLFEISAQIQARAAEM